MKYELLDLKDKCNPDNELFKVTKEEIILEETKNKLKSK